MLTDKNKYSNNVGNNDGVVAELVDAPDSKSGSLGSESSILSGPTIEDLYVKTSFTDVFLICRNVMINCKFCKIKWV